MEGFIAFFSTDLTAMGTVAINPQWLTLLLGAPRGQLWFANPDVSTASCESLTTTSDVIFTPL